MPAAPAASCALCIGRTHTSKRVHRNHPTFPHAMVLTVSFVLSPVTGLVCHRHQRIKVLSKPGRADSTSANLTPASGRQDHTTSPYASAPFVSSPFDCSRIPWRTRPASRCAPDTAASTASHPASVTIAIRPSVGRDAKSSRSDLGCLETEIFFAKGTRHKMARRANHHGGGEPLSCLESASRFCERNKRKSLAS
jgi:hypothetical protein